MKKGYQALLLASAMLVSGLLQAGEIKDLYLSTLLVPEQGSAPTTEQLTQGLQRVLVRVAGNRELLGKPAIQQALETPDALLRRFEYQQTDEAVADALGTEQPAQALSMEFDSALVDQLLRQSNERPLGSQRPTLMLWLAAEQGARRDYVPPESRLLQPLFVAARARGLPVQMPLYDLTDQQNLSISDLWGLFGDGIAKASARYRPDATLAGRIAPLPGGNWYIEWLLLGVGPAQRFTTEGYSDEALIDAIEQVANRLFASLGSNSSGAFMEGLQLEVTNVRTLADYAAVIAYLEQLTLVTSVAVEQVNGDRLLLRIQLDGRAEQLQRAIQLQPRLSPDSTNRLNGHEQQGGVTGNDENVPAESGAFDVVPVENTLFLRYRWQG